MIKTFKHKGLRRFFEDDDGKLLNAKHCDRISRILDRLDTSVDVKDMDLPGFNLHPLLGDRKEIWSVTVQKNWRITIHFEGSHAYDVNLEDYH